MRPEKKVTMGGIQGYIRIHKHIRSVTKKGKEVGTGRVDTLGNTRIGE